MVSTRFYLDCRASEDREAPLKIAITKRGRTAYLPTVHKLLPAHWDAEHQKVVKHPSRNALNTVLMELMIDVRNRISKMVMSGEAATLTSTQIKNIIHEQLTGITPTSFIEFFRRIESTKSKGTQEVYQCAWKRFALFCEENNTNSERISVGSINSKTASAFDAWLKSKYAGNTRNSTIACIKAVLELAVDEGLISRNPFLDIKQKYVTTKKRDLNIDQLRALFSYSGNPEHLVFIDLLKFSFLTRAANLADIWEMTPSDIFNGRIEYTRAKTKKRYSVLIEPELQDIIDRRGNWRKLFYIESPKTKRGFMRVMTAHLREISAELGLPEITLYWIRHSFASIAMELEVPVDIISAMLGHTTGARVTMGYIDIKSRQVDLAARRVYDYVLYGRSEISSTSAN